MFNELPAGACHIADFARRAIDDGFIQREIQFFEQLDRVKRRRFVQAIEQEGIKCFFLIEDAQDIREFGLVAPPNVYRVAYVVHRRHMFGDFDEALFAELRDINTQ